MPIDRAFTYSVPEDLHFVQPGMRVLAPFGRQDLTGIVVSVAQQSHWPKTKNIVDVLDPEPLITPQMLELTRWIAEYYMSSWGQAAFLALPRGTEEAVKDKVFLVSDVLDESLTERQKELYLMISENPGKTKTYYRRKFGYGSFYSILNVLQKKGLVYVEKEHVEARAKELQRKYIEIPENYLELKQQFPDFLKYVKKRPEVDQFLTEYAGKQLLQKDFLEQTGMAHGTMLKMVAYGLLNQVMKRYERRLHFEPQEEPKIERLSAEQSQALQTILPAVQAGAFKTFLIHGVTGSGKTQVYIEVLKRVLEQGRTALVLIPEIALTPQTVRRFQRIVGEDKIAVFHSKMSLGERLDYWMACYEGRIQCVVGPRSALFAPLKNIGLIVVDEEHEHTYKQSDLEPRYHARDVAVYWGKMNEAVVLLGSATPSLESYLNVRRGKYHLIEMKKRIDDVKLPEVEIINMRTAKKMGEGELRLFSQMLIEKISERLVKGEQVMLLQNRRGYSAMMQCSNCGYIPLCPNCDISLTYHSYGNKLQCHLCGHRMPAYEFCPNCGGEQIIYKGTGTQRIEQALKHFLPQARILRMDRDTTRGKEGHEKILQAFARGESDILLGTQMIAKGLDFGNVTLVGVVSADVGLSIPDFRAPERIFQLLTQVAGRAGRRQKQGEVVVQTYSHTHYAIQFARYHDYAGFFNEEIKHRQNFKYPPFVRLIQILVSAENLSAALQKSREITSLLRRIVVRYAQVLGPAPAIVERLNNQHRWVISLKLNPQTDPTGKKTKELLKRHLSALFEHRKKGVQVIVDVDPLTLN